MKQKLKQKILGYLLAVTAVFSVFAGMGASAAETEQESVPGYTVTLQQTAHGKLSFRDISGDQGQFEKDAENVEQYSNNQQTFYILSNVDTITATWSDGLLVEQIAGNISDEDIKKIIDSIGVV